MLKIKERDEKIFNILFRLRYMTARQICKYVNCEYTRFIRRSIELINDGYIECNWMQNVDKNIYSNGIMVRRDQERDSYKKKVNINSYTLQHHLLINDVYIHMVKELGVKEEDITTERETYWSRTGILDKRKKIKIPDLIIEKENKLVAVEVEKTKKNEESLRNVLMNYDFYTSFYCVRYICSKKGIMNFVINTAEKENITFVKAYTIDEFYNGVDIFGF